MTDVCNDNYKHAETEQTRTRTIRLDYKYERETFAKAHAYESKTGRTSLESHQKNTLAGHIVFGTIRT